MKSKVYQTILFSVQDKVGTVTLNRPESYNAIDTVMCSELLDVLSIAKEDNNIHTLLIKSNGKAFCSGGDIKQMLSEGKKDTVAIIEHTKLYQDMAQALIKFPKPTVCAVGGVAAGAGFSVALACDIVIGSTSAKFAQSFVQVGLMPDCGSTYLLSRLIGRAKAKELVFSGRTVEAKEALDLGIMVKLVLEEELESCAFLTAKEYAKGPTVAMSLAKKSIDASFESSLDKALEMETLGQCICFTTEDHQEGLRAFMEKRLPNFNRG